MGDYTTYEEWLRQKWARNTWLLNKLYDIWYWRNRINIFTASLPAAGLNAIIFSYVYLPWLESFTSFLKLRHLLERSEADWWKTKDSHGLYQTTCHKQDAFNPIGKLLYDSWVGAFSRGHILSVNRWPTDVRDTSIAKNSMSGLFWTEWLTISCN